MCRLFDVQPYANKRVCVAFSGGGDSTALFFWLLDHAAEFGISLSAVNVEHGIRGERSRADSAFVRSVCEREGVPLYCFAADVPSLARAGGEGMEEAARRYRYACFEQILREDKADLVATAHHAGDNAESVLFNLFRGCALRGVGGIADSIPCGGKAVVRPMLGVTEGQVQAYLRARALSFCEDETNADLRYARNFLRHAVLAPAERRFGSLEEHVYAFSRLAREDDDFLYSLAAGALEFDGAEAHIPADLEKPLFSRCIVLAYRKFGFGEDYTRAGIEAAYALRAAHCGVSADLPFGLRAVRDAARITLYRAGAAPAAEEFPFGAGEFRFSCGACAAVFPVEHADFSRQGVLYIDADRLPEGCVIRLRRDGDMFRKFGGGTQKLKKFLIDRKIDRRRRDSLPLLAKGRDVYAVFGEEIAESVRIGKDTKRIFALQ